MRRPPTPPLLLAAALVATLAALPLTLTSCDSGGDPPPPEPKNQAPTASVSIEPTTTETGVTVTFDGSESSDNDGSIRSYAWSFGDGDDGSGETTTHVFAEAGDYTAELTVTDNDDAVDTDETSVTVTEATPENVAVTFNIKADDSGDPVATDITYRRDGRPDSLVVEDRSEGEFTLPYREAEAGLVTTATDRFESTSLSVTPNRNRDVSFTVNRKQVSVTVEAVAVGSRDELTAPVELTAGDDTLASGTTPFTAAVPEGAGELTATSGEHQEALEVYADTSAAFTASAGAITLKKRRVLHCANPFDNDGDGLVGVWKDLDGNGIPTEGDAGDPGCPEASDDNEEHRVRTVTFPGVGTSDSVFVSSDPDHWKLFPGSSDFSQSITVAVGNVFFGIDAKLSSAQSDEAFAVQFMCGSRTNISETVEDDPSVDGWYTPVVLGITPDFFAESTDCEFTAVHKAFVNDNPGDGNDDVIFGYPERTGSYVISWVYQSDDTAINGGSVSSIEGAAAGARTKLGRARSGSRDGDVSVRQSGYANSATADR